jgi:hypothetical protein
VWDILLIVSGKIPRKLNFYSVEIVVDVIVSRVGIGNPSFIAVNNVDLSEDGPSITKERK